MKRVFLVTLCLGAVVPLLFLMGHTEPPQARLNPPPTTSVPTATVFDFDYRATTAIQVGAPEAPKSLNGTIDVAGELIVTPLPPASAGAPSARRVRVQVGRLDRHTFTFLDKPVLDAASDANAVFGDIDIVVHVGPYGFVTAIEETDAPQVGHHLLETLAIDMLVALDVPDEVGAFRQETTRGVASGVATISHDDRHVTRTITSYEDIPGVDDDASGAVEVRGDGQLQFDHDGLLATAQGSEAITAPGFSSSVRWSLRADGVQPVEAIASPSRETRRPGRAQARKSHEAQHLSQRVGALTAQDLLQGILDFAATGRLAERNRFFWNATGLLQQDPSLAHQVAALLGDDRLNPNARRLVADLLVSVGHAQAQQAYRNALHENLPRFERTEAVSLVHRLAHLARPEPQSIAMVESRFEHPDSAVAHAAAFTLGAMAQRVEGEARDGLMGRLQGMLTEDASVSQVTAALAGLGNAGQHDTVDLVSPYTSHQAAAVRRQAAHTLGKLGSDQAHDLLIGMLGDDSEWVQRDVLLSLGKYGWSEPLGQELARLVTSGVLGEPNYAGVLNLFSGVSKPHAAVSQALAVMASAPLKRASLRQRIADLQHKLSMMM